jgi:hypothetical protein
MVAPAVFEAVAARVNEMCMVGSGGKGVLQDSRLERRCIAFPGERRLVRWHGACRPLADSQVVSIGRIAIPIDLAVHQCRQAASGTRTDGAGTDLERLGLDIDGGDVGCTVLAGGASGRRASRRRLWRRRRRHGGGGSAVESLLAGTGRGTDTATTTTVQQCNSATVQQCSSAAVQKGML